MTPYTIRYGPWLPDMANAGFPIIYASGTLDVPCADCNNVVYSNSNYKSLPSPAAVAGTPALPVSMLVGGAYTYMNPAGNAMPIVGTLGLNNVYYWNGSAWISTGLSISAPEFDHWNFAQFGNSLIAQASSVNVAPGGGVDTNNLYTLTLGGGGTALTGSPNGSIMAVVGQFLMIGDIYGASGSASLGTGDGSTKTFTGTVANHPTYGASVLVEIGGVGQALDNGQGAVAGAGGTGTINYNTGAISFTFYTAPSNGASITTTSAASYKTRVWWSGIGDYTSWPTPLTNAAIAAQSSYEDLEAQYGSVMFIAGYPLYGVIFQRNAITRAQYVGGDVVFTFQTYSRNLGLAGKHAAVQVGATTYFLADQGFYVTDGANVTPIGTAQDNSSGIDGWFWSHLTAGTLDSIRAGYDARLRCVFFSIVTAGNPALPPDTLLIYNVLAQRWTKASIGIANCLWTDSDGTTDRLGMLHRTGPTDASAPVYTLLTGASAAGYLESCDLAMSDGNMRLTTGARPNIACVDTPTVTVGNRNNLESSVTYSSAMSPDALSGIAPFLAQGLYTRVRVTSSNAQAISGATLYQKAGGPM